ncbi:hypothetical protein PAEPH01_2902 [Pancytospora epiphaga]|nr:hypothetical protein PAEPH01_2902 [Pancytospora epiphaga]
MALPQLRTLLHRVKCLPSSLTLSSTLTREFSHYLSGFKLKVLKRQVELGDVENAMLVHKELSEFFGNEEIEGLRNILLEFVINHIKNKAYDNYEYLKTEAADLGRLRACLGHKGTEQNKKLGVFLRKNRNRVIEDIAKNITGAMMDGNEVGVLIEVLRVIENSPTFCKDIIFETKNEILKNPILHHFLQRYIRMGPPVLSSAEELQVERLERQFGFLLEDKM